MTMRTVALRISVAFLCLSSVSGESKNQERLNESAAVFEEVMSTPDKAIPKDLLDRAHCVVIVPGLKKGAFIFGAQYGKGYISCRQVGRRGWSAPATMRVEGGSVGFQIGGTETDVILLVMNTRGADSLMRSKFTIGGAAQAAAGPVGRTATAETDAQMRAEILSYSRARGIFAGISLQGATLRQDLDSNKAMYGKPYTTAQIVREHKAQAGPSGRKLLSVLSKYSSKELS